MWQVAVNEDFRGQSLASRMLAQLLKRPACLDVVQLETSVTESNTASRALFQRLATDLKTDLHSEILFDHAAHFSGDHASEYLLRIGPISRT